MSICHLSRKKKRSFIQNNDQVYLLLQRDLQNRQTPWLISTVLGCLKYINCVPVPQKHTNKICNSNTLTQIRHTQLCLLLICNQCKTCLFSERTRKHLADVCSESLYRQSGWTIKSHRVKTRRMQETKRSRKVWVNCRIALIKKEMTNWIHKEATARRLKDETI